MAVEENEPISWREALIVWLDRGLVLLMVAILLTLSLPLALMLTGGGRHVSTTDTQTIRVPPPSNEKYSDNIVMRFQGKTLRII